MIFRQSSLARGLFQSSPCALCDQCRMWCWQSPQGLLSTTPKMKLPNFGSKWIVPCNTLQKDCSWFRMCLSIMHHHALLSQVQCSTGGKSFDNSRAMCRCIPCGTHDCMARQIHHPSFRSGSSKLDILFPWIRYMPLDEELHWFPLHSQNISWESFHQVEATSHSPECANAEMKNGKPHFVTYIFKPPRTKKNRWLVEWDS